MKFYNPSQECIERLKGLGYRLEWCYKGHQVPETEINLHDYGNKPEIRLVYNYSMGDEEFQQLRIYFGDPHVRDKPRRI